MSFPKEIWEISCEEELLTSGNDTDEEENFFEEPNGYQNEIAETRRQVNPNWKKVSKNVRFEGPESNYLHDLSETSSMENELADGGCGHEDRRRFLGPELTKMKEHSRMNHKPKWRTVDYYDKKYDRRPKSTPEKSSGYFEGNVERRPGTFGEYGEEIEQRHRMKRKEHRCGRTQPDVDIDYICGDVNRKPRYKFEYSDEMRRQHHGDCCNYRSMVDEGRKKNYLKSKSVQKHFCHVKDSLDNTISKGYKKPYSNRMVQDKKFDTFPYHSVADHYCHSDEYHEHTKSKKKILEAVQEQQEHFSDSTYKLSCPKFSNHTIPNDLIEFTGMRPSEKLTNSSRSDCMYWNGKNYGDKMFQPHRLHKMRSRRTRMNRLKNGWKKAFVQTGTFLNENE